MPTRINEERNDTNYGNGLNHTHWVTDQNFVQWQIICYHVHFKWICLTGAEMLPDFVSRYRNGYTTKWLTNVILQTNLLIRSPVFQLFNYQHELKLKQQFNITKKLIEANACRLAKKTYSSILRQEYTVNEDVVHVWLSTVTITDTFTWAANKHTHTLPYNL